MDFSKILDHIIKLEGGWQLTNHLHDKGGMTYAGISRRANENWPGWDLIDKGVLGSPELKKLVESRYRSKYWDAIEGDSLVSEAVARAMMSCAVVSGPVTAVKLAQMALDLKADGVIGQNTRKALLLLIPDMDNEERFMLRFALARIARFSQIVARNKTQGKFLRGWINRALEDAA